jgi:hypothetical protein
MRKVLKCDEKKPNLNQASAKHEKAYVRCETKKKKEDVKIAAALN